MKKIVLGAVLVLLVTIGFSVYYLLSNLDSIVKAAIETYGSQATQTEVKVDSVQIGLKEGAGAIRGLTVGNPQGFSAPRAFSLDEIATRIDLESLSQEVFVIEHVTVRAPTVFFELNQAGKNNLNALKQNLASGSAPSSAEKSSGPEPKLIIRRLTFADGSIHATVVPLNKDYELKLPKIEMTNLGGRNGATPTQIAEQVLEQLSDRALAEVKRKGLDQYKAQLEGEVRKQLDAEKEKVGDEVRDKLKGLLNN